MSSLSFLLVPEHPLTPSSIAKPFDACDVDAADEENLQYALLPTSPASFAGAVSINAVSGDLYIEDSYRLLFDFECVWKLVYV